MSIPRVLSIAGTDPTGGAGIQADLKTIGALGGYGMAVTTALVAQNTRGVRSIHVPPVSFLTEQLRAVSDDVEIDAVKIGMLHSAPLVDAVSDWLRRTRPPVVVLDPVMVATSGDRLLDGVAVAAIRRMCRNVDLVTPNIPELAVLADTAPARTWSDAVVQAQVFATQTGTAVLLKGGHLTGPICTDAIVTADSVRPVEGPRKNTSSTHGTGCTLSSAMATLAASGWTWFESLQRAKSWLAEAIDHGAELKVGEGAGPVDHFHETRPNLPGPAPWTTLAWEETSHLRTLIRSCSFVRMLGDGTLPSSRFQAYLAQDALYLAEYARLLVVVSAKTRDPQERLFWTRGAAVVLAEEERLRREWGNQMAQPTSATRDYINHLTLTARRGGRAELAAALLPCFMVYADLGEKMAGLDHASHPYGEWLRMYTDPSFTAASRQAAAFVDRIAAHSTAGQRERMLEAFARSMRHELAFFESAAG